MGKVSHLSIRLWEGTIPLHMAVGRYHTSPYGCGKVPYLSIWLWEGTIPIHKAVGEVSYLSIRLWEGIIPLYMAVGRCHTSPYGCGKVSYLSIWMWEGTIPLHNHSPKQMRQKNRRSSICIEDKRRISKMLV